MRRVVSLLLLLLLAGTVSAAAPATAPPPVAATVTAVVDGDELLVRLETGKAERVRVAGIRAPASGSCYAAEVAAEARLLALGKRVTLLRDGEAWYATLPDGVDLGRRLVARGLAQVDVWGPPFGRFLSYVPAQRSAEAASTGLWGACAADVAVTLTASPSAVRAGGRVTYTATVVNRGPLAATRVVLELRPPPGVELINAESAVGTCVAGDWLATCTFSALDPGARATATFAAEPGRPGAVSTRAVVRLEGCIRASCGSAPFHDANLRNDETAALATVLDETAPPPTGGPQPGTGVCHPAYPDSCIPPPPPDLDCADIPFRDFYVRHDIPDSDPHVLDGNEDGLGCQFDDY